jgi:hypothetical protein
LRCFKTKNSPNLLQTLRGLIDLEEFRYLAGLFFVLNPGLQAGGELIIAPEKITAVQALSENLIFVGLRNITQRYSDENSPIP